jgi:hypothetical protein
MLRDMNSQVEPGEDRRAVPRHLRDREHDITESSGVFGQRSEDAVSRRGRGWALLLLALAAALALGWFLLSQVRLPN